MKTTLATLRGAPRYLLIAAVRAYRLLLSPWLGSSCRFEPTCSAYSLQALKTHGAATGTYLTLHRLARCHPLCAGGHDPVPDPAMRLFSWFGARSLRAESRFSPTSNDKSSP